MELKSVKVNATKKVTWAWQAAHSVDLEYIA